MPRTKKTEKKDNLYGLKEVQVRLKLSEGTTLYSTEPLSDPGSAIRVMASALKEMDREYFCVVNMDAHLRAINFNIVSIGGINACHVPIQNVFKASLLSNSSTILLIHTHPSGILSPSQSDYEITKKLIEAGNLLEIQVQDHIIVAGGTGLWYSFREHEPGLFETADPNMQAVREGSGRRSILTDLKEKRNKDMRTDKVPLKRPNQTQECSR